MTIECNRSSLLHLGYSPRVFADVSLAAEIDGAEGRMCAGIAERTKMRRPDSHALVSRLAGGVIAYVGPGSPTNKGIGLGLGQPMEESALEAVEAEWRDRHEPLRIELATLADGSVSSLLTSRGYRLLGFENVLGLALNTMDFAPSASDVTIERLGTDGERTWLDVTVEGFAHPDAVALITETYPREVLELAFADLANSTGFVRYAAMIEGGMVGAASLRIDGAIAQLCGAATLPAYRRRGVQTGLLRRRLADAYEAGCRLAVITTQPGSKSQENSQRRGFELLYARAILVREWP
jgi:GNAT superfamily N-acetyltransferase